jgi:hypothetical protein
MPEIMPLVHKKEFENWFMEHFKYKATTSACFNHEFNKEAQRASDARNEADWLIEFRNVICNKDCDGKANPDIACDDDCLFTDWLDDRVAKLQAIEKEK